jgi:hypothetical protein
MFEAVNHRDCSFSHAKLGCSATIGGGSINKI